MANIMTKRGSLDNIVTYEHICDTSADMSNIDPHYITLGSICIVINEEGEGMEVYMANSNKEWNSIATGVGSGDGGSGVSSLVELLDVGILNPTDGQTLTYDATVGKWVNGGSGVMVVKTTSDEMGNMTFDHTWDEMFRSMANGVPVLLCDITGLSAVTKFVSLDTPEVDIFTATVNDIQFTCNDPYDYPTLAGIGGIVDEPGGGVN